MYKKFGIAAVAMVLAAGYAARAELVYDNPPADPTAAEVKSRADERETSRAVIQSAEKAKATSDASSAKAVSSIEVVEPVITAPSAPISSPATATPAQASGSTDVQNLSRSELLRRERVREEIKNEDMLQERIEELRLHDEQGRTDKILKKDDVAATPALGLAPQTQAVTAPAVDAPGQHKDQISMSQAATVTTAPVGTSTAVPEEKKDGTSDATTIGVTARGGMSSLSSANGLNVNARYSLGADVTADVSDNVTLEGGYQFSQYGLNLASNNPFVNFMNSTPGFNSAAASGQTAYVYNQNVFDVGARLYVLDRSSKIRPYIGGGAGYGRGYVNYDQSYLNAARQLGLNNITSDYETSQFLGYLSAGLDLQVSKSIKITGQFKYYNVLSATENGSLNYAALGYGAYMSPAAYLAAVDQAGKAALGGSIDQSAFYSATAGLTFGF